MGKKRVLVLIAGILVVALLPCSVNAEDPVLPHRIGFLTPNTPAASAAYLNALRQGLHEFGYEDGKNIVIEERYAEAVPERLPAMVAELVAQRVEVIVTGSIPSALAAKKTTTTVPVVVAAAGDFVGNGLAASRERPGGNITGVDEVVPGLSARRLELLHEAVPGVSTIAVLSTATAPTHALQLKDTEHAAQRLGISLQTIRISDPKEFEAAFDSMARQKAGALLVFSGVLSNIHSKTIVELAKKKKLPGMYWSFRFTEAGGLMYYGPNLVAMFKQSASIVDRILKGAKPGEIPVEYAKEFELIINLRTAKELGIAIPPSVLAQAKRVID